MPTPPLDVILTHAAAILAEYAVPDSFPARGRAWPSAKALQRLRKAGWPVEIVTAVLPQTEHSGPRAGQRTADAEQPVGVVPEAWLRELARRCGCRLSEICRGIIADEG